MIRKLPLLLAILLAAIASIPTSASKLEAKRNVVSNGYNFWLFQPDSSTIENPKPLVVFLHGASLCGNNLDKVRRYGTIDAIERGRDIDAFVIAPQNPGGSWNPAKVMNIVDYVMETHHVDSARVYVIGMSLGGYGTLDFAATYPDRIAAAMAFCGGATVADLSGLNKLPLWIVHGTADRAVAVEQSDRVVGAMKEFDSETPRLIYDRVPGMNHGKPARFFYMKETYDWLFSHSLLDENRPATEAFDMVGSTGSAYKDLHYKSKQSKAKSHRKRSKAKMSGRKKKHRSKRR